MSNGAFGYWAMVLAVMASAARAMPHILVQHPDHRWLVLSAGIVFGCYVAATVSTVCRVGAADRESAARFIWVQGAVGLALAASLLWLL
jgi:hypothetical protein